MSNSDFSAGITVDEVRQALRAAAHALATLSIAHQLVDAPTSPPAEPVHAPTLYRPVEANILEAAPGPADLPVNMKRLAKLAGYAYTRHFREAVHALVGAGRLSRHRDGVRRA